MNKSVAINRKFTNIALNYEMHVDYLYIDADAIRIKYRIIPPLSSDSLEQHGIPVITWWGYARDNHGGDYQSAGGASGVSSNTFTDGVLSFLPLPSEEVNCLDITMILILRGIDTKTKLEFSVSF